MAHQALSVSTKRASILPAPPPHPERVFATAGIPRRERLSCGLGGANHNEKIPRRFYFPAYGEHLADLPN